MIRLATSLAAAPDDVLRPPSPLDLLASAYKDWFHVNLFDPVSGVVAVVNASLHGDPVAPNSLAVGTFLAHVPGRSPALLAHVDVRVRSDADVQVGAARIAVGTTARIALGDDGWYLRATARHGRVALDVVATPSSLPIVVEAPVPFGAGWISWRAVPRLHVDGWLEIDGRRLSMCGAIAYHDHNWGRWRWGDDIGWRWGTFPCSDDDTTVTVAHRTDRRHRSGAPIARVQAGGAVRDFAAGTVRIRHSGRRDVPLRRLPGALAALRSDRQRPHLPECIGVRVSDGIDRVDVEFCVDDAVQLVTADPASAGQTFIHELFGRFVVDGHVAGVPVCGSGLGVFEHVD